jgi:hypothetical protein
MFLESKTPFHLIILRDTALNFKDSGVDIDIYCSY